MESCQSKVKKTFSQQVNDSASFFAPPSEFSRSGYNEVPFGNRVVDDVFTILDNTPSSGNVLVYTELEFYALTPALNRAGRLERVEAQDMAGVVEIQLRGGSASSIRLSGEGFNPINVADGAPGWGLMNSPLAIRNQGMVTPWVLENRGMIRIRVENIPRIWIAKMGVRTAGFELSTTLYQRIIKAAASEPE